MIGPLAAPFPAAERPELPRVRLEVRAGAGRPVSYEVGGPVFLIGAAGGCDLRIPTPNTPPVICQITRKAEGIQIRRLTPVLPVLLNGSPLPTNAPAILNSGDTLAFAGLEAVVTIDPPPLLVPRFVPLEPSRSVPVSASPSHGPGLTPATSNDVTRPGLAWADELNRREAELAHRADELNRREAELAHRADELEADRVLWYQRRREIEAEIEQHRSAEQTLAARCAEVERLKAQAEQTLAEAQAQAAELLRRTEHELEQKRTACAAELATYEPRLQELRAERERLAATAQELERQKQLLAADRTLLEHERGTFIAHRDAEEERLQAREARLTEREADLARREEQLHRDQDALEQDRKQLQADLLRLERRATELEEQERRLTERTREVDLRLVQLRRDAAEWEETVRQAAAEQARLQTEAERLDRRRLELDEQTAALTERAGQLESQQAVLTLLKAQLDRTRQEVEREAAELAAARARQDEALAALQERIREAEELRAELATVQENTAQERRRLDERDQLLTTGLEEIRSQRESLTREAERLKLLEAELDRRAAEFAEQAGLLKGRLTQALDLQARLEADRVALREREAALARAEEARQNLQEQLRRRAEELTARAQALDEQARQVAAERATLEDERRRFEEYRTSVITALEAQHRAIEERTGQLEQIRTANAVKEEALARQLARLREVGASIAAERKALRELRARWEADRAAAAEAERTALAELDALRLRVAEELESLRRQAPELEAQATAAWDRLSSARDMLRGHLSELHEFARLSRDDLTAIRDQIRQEAERLREHEEALNRAKAEHRLSVSAFRQQLIDWQAQVAEMKRTLAASESRLDARQAAVDEAARQIDATSAQLAEQAEQLRRERELVASQRSEVERHLADMREWYRKKLRELARSRAAESAHAAPIPRLADLDEPTRDADTDSPVTLPHPTIRADLIEPADRQLGELLRSHGLVDPETLEALWAEAGRQRRTLRQVLLASGAITLYQLALIEAGNLDALMIGRFRVIDRLRVTPRETLYRVFDPTRCHPSNASQPPASSPLPPTGFVQPTAGVFLLRHLAESEMQDAVHPDEYRQRFATARDAAHPNLEAVIEVLEIGGRPAVLQEWLVGLHSTDWPSYAAHPGCWLRLLRMAAEGIEAAHQHGLIHGRLSPESFVLTPAGLLKVTGFGEPLWLTTNPEARIGTSVAADLQALGRVASGWSQLVSRQPRRSVKPKSFPARLVRIIRRLEAEPEPPMADTVAPERPYGSVSELLADLEQAARETTFSDDAWEKLLRYAIDHTTDPAAGLRRSA